MRSQEESRWRRRLDLVHLLLVVAEVVPERLGELVAAQLAGVCRGHPQQEDAVVSQEVEDEAAEGLGVDHLVALDADEVLAHEVHATPRHDGDEDPVDEAAEGGRRQQEVPEPQEQEDLLVEPGKFTQSWLPSQKRRLDLNLKDLRRVTASDSILGQRHTKILDSM